jgi:hypothetical protein
VTVGLASSVHAAVLDVVFRSVDYAGPAAIYAKLHTADPGAAGATAAAANATRKLVTFGAASGATISNSAQVLWENVPATETYTHVSLWDAASAGNFVGSAVLAAQQAVQIFDNFSLEAGAVVVTNTPVAA